MTVSWRFVEEHEHKNALRARAAFLQLPAACRFARCMQQGEAAPGAWAVHAVHLRKLAGVLERPALQAGQ